MTQHGFYFTDTVRKVLADAREESDLPYTLYREMTTDGSVEVES